MNIISGIPKLDVLLGFHSGDLVILSSRPGVGKTTLAIQMAEYISISMQLPCIYFSLNGEKHYLIDKVYKRLFMYKDVCKEFEEVDWKLNNLTEKEYVRLYGKKSMFKRAMFIFKNSKNMDLRYIKEYIKKIKSTIGLEFVVIDYLEMLRNPISSIRAFKKLAKELEICIVVLSILSRSKIRRKESRPVLKDLRYMGRVESFADSVLFLYKELYAGIMKNSSKVELILAKTRHGRGDESIKLALNDEGRFK